MTAIELRVREASQCTVVMLHGDLDVVDAAQVEAAVVTAATTGRTVIVDLAALEFLDCAALRALAQARQRARHEGGDVLLAGPRLIVRQLLSLTGMDDVFTVLPSAGDTVAAGGGGQGVRDG